MAKKTRTSESPDADLPRFEQAFDQLKEIVDQLEQGQLTLAQSLQRYEQGVKYLAQCYAALDQAEQRIQQLVQLDENGRLVTEPFVTHTDDDATGVGQSPRRKKKRKRPPATDHDSSDGLF